MNLVIPDEAQIHITMGSGPVLALTHDAEGGTSSGGSRHIVRNLLLAGCVLVGGFTAGRYTGASRMAPAALAASTTGQVPPSNGLPGGGNVGDAGPNGPGVAADGPAGIPPGFQEQLASPPRVTPPPGQAGAAGAANGAANPFGLHE